MRNRITLLLAIAALGIGCSADYPGSPTATPSLAAIQIHFPSLAHTAMGAGGSVLLRLYAVDTEGVYEEVTTRASWFSTDRAVINVSRGQVSGLRPGQADVVASYQGLTSTARLVVVDPNRPWPRLEIGDFFSVQTGRTTRAAARFFEIGAAGRDVTTQATWASSDSRVFTVEAGQITAQGPGTAAIIVTFNGVSATAYSSVPPLQSLP